MVAWRVAEALNTLLGQVNAVAPTRSKVSDGTIGDAAHQATDSKHNPRHVTALGATPVVLARDITHDPGHGADMGKLFHALAEGRDSRIGVVIHNGLIVSSTRQPWVIRSYDGKNPHRTHLHVDLIAAARADDRSPFHMGGFAMGQPVTTDVSATIKWEIRPWLGDVHADAQAAVDKLAEMDAADEATARVVQEIREILATQVNTPAVLDLNALAEILRPIIRTEIRQALATLVLQGSFGEVPQGG